MFPLESVMLPGETLPLHIFEPRYAALVGDCLSGGGRCFGVVLIAAGREVGGGDRRCDVGALARIVEHAELGSGRHMLRCAVGARIRVVRWLADDPYPRALVEPYPDEVGDAVADPAIREVEDRIVALYRRIAEARKTGLPGRDTMLGAPLSNDATHRLYALASRVPMGQADRYSVLAAPTPAARLAALNEAITTVAAMLEFRLSSDQS
jgi:Lon protease-like protein